MNNRDANSLIRLIREVNLATMRGEISAEDAEAIHRAAASEQIARMLGERLGRELEKSAKPLLSALVPGAAP